MTEQTPEQPGTGGQSDPTPDPAPEVTNSPVVATYKAKAPADNEGSGRFAVYDLTLERYVSEVMDTKPSSKDAKAAVAEGHTYKVIEV